MISVKLLSSGRVATLSEDAEEREHTDFHIEYQNDYSPLATRLVPNAALPDGSEWGFDGEFAFPTGDIAAHAERSEYVRVALGFHALPVFDKVVTP